MKHTFVANRFLESPDVKLKCSEMCCTVKLSFHMIAHDRRTLNMLPAIVSDYMETLFSNRQRLHGNTFQRSGDRRRLSAILRFSDSSDPAIVSDHMETKLKIPPSHVMQASN